MADALLQDLPSFMERFGTDTPCRAYLVEVNRTGFPEGPDFWKDGVHDEQDDAIEGVSGGVA
jgi:hypothetical protein